MMVGWEKGMEEGYPRCGAFASGLFEDRITPASSFPFRWLLHLGLGKKGVYFCLRGAAGTMVRATEILKQTGVAFK